MTTPVELPDASPSAIESTACTKDDPPKSGRFRVRELVCMVLILVFGAGLSWERLSPTTRGTLWAEDVRNFIGNAVHSGPITPLLHPYAGYLQLVPRVIADVTVGFEPVSSWALSMAAGSCLVTGGCATVVFICSAEITDSTLLRVFIACITLLDPLAPREVLGNTANLHWYFLWTTPWLLIYRPRTRVGGWALGAVALLAALSEIQMILFVPLLLWKWRDRIRRPVRGLFLIGLTGQIVATLCAPRGASAGHLLGPGALGYGYLINCVMTIFDPNPKEVGSLISFGGAAVGVALLIPFAMAARYAVKQGTQVQRILAITLSLGSLVLYMLAVEISPGAFYDYTAMSRTQLADPWLARYGVVPSMFLIALIPLAYIVWAQARHRPLASGRLSPIRSIAGRLMLATFLILLVIHLVPVATRRSNGPVLVTQVTAQEIVCSGQSARHEVTLLGDPGPGWKVELSCRYLREHG